MTSDDKVTNEKLQLKRSNTCICLFLSLYIQHFISQREEFETARDNMLVWLTEMDLQLTNIEHFSECDVQAKIKQLRVRQNYSLQRMQHANMIHNTTTARTVSPQMSTECIRIYALIVVLSIVLYTICYSIEEPHLLLIYYFLKMRGKLIKIR